MICELFHSCPYTACRELHATYCCSNPFICARRRVAMTIGTDKVPADLLPSQSERILGLITQHHVSSRKACFHA